LANDLQAIKLNLIAKGAVFFLDILIKSLTGWDFCDIIKSSFISTFFVWKKPPRGKREEG
jgi:hypothetical protein